MAATQAAVEDIVNMANSNFITNTTVFEPLTYDEIYEPLAESTAVHNQVADAYAELDAKASVWENMANKTTDRRTYEQYMRYANELRQHVNELATNGLNVNTRNSLRKMYGRYQQEITPIENAYKTRAEQAKQQMDWHAKDPTVMFNFDASKMSLDDYLANPQMQYQAVSGQALTQRVGNAVANLKNQLKNITGWAHTAEGQMLERIEQYGLSQGDMNLIRSNPAAYPAITKLISDVVTSSGVGQWTDRDGNIQEDRVDEALNYAYEGLWQGIGQTKQVAQRDAGYITPYQRWQMARQVDNDKFSNLLKLKKAGLINPDGTVKTSDDIRNGLYLPVPGNANPREEKAKRKQANSDIDKIQKVIDRTASDNDVADVEALMNKYNVANPQELIGTIQHEADMVHTSEMYQANFQNSQYVNDVLLSRVLGASTNTIKGDNKRAAKRALEGIFIMPNGKSLGKDDAENALKAFKDGLISIDSRTGRLCIRSNNYGTYYFSDAAAQNALYGEIDPATGMSLFDLLQEISERVAVKNASRDPKEKMAQHEAIQDEVATIFAALLNINNGAIPGTPATSSKSRTRNTEFNIEDTPVTASYPMPDGSYGSYDDYGEYTE